ncbi:hypothetical protein [Bacillus subtilis]|uniref:hypothetical protein n=1 Tax=Bacillus subtilis TaxID=1423 RepID=UPI004045F078
MKINDYELKKGQYIRSYSKLCDDLAIKKGRGLTKFTRAAVKAAAERLQAKGMITAEETEYGMLWTVLNYSKFQGAAEEPTYENKAKEKPKAPQQKDEGSTSFQKIEEKFTSRKGSLFLSAVDTAAIKRVIEAEIPIDDVLTWIDEIFDQYKPKYPGDKINSFSYCEPIIRDRWAAKHSEKQPSNVSEFKPRGSVQQNSFAALEAYAKEKGIGI